MLVEVLIDVILILPYIIYNYIYSNVVTFSGSLSIAQNQLIDAITRIFFYGAFAVSYIDECRQKRIFRF